MFENNHVQNGDDCLTVGNGAKNIEWRLDRIYPVNMNAIDLTAACRNSYCEGGHGLSIGSLGEGGQVADVENVM